MQTCPLLSAPRYSYLGTPPLPGALANPRISLPTVGNLCGSHLLFLLPPGPPHSIPTLDSMRKTYFSFPPLPLGFMSFPANPTLLTGLEREHVTHPVESDVSFDLGEDDVLGIDTVLEKTQVPFQKRT